LIPRSTDFCRDQIDNWHNVYQFDAVGDVLT
jgi:hypothetical protein